MRSVVYYGEYNSEDISIIRAYLNQIIGTNLSPRFIIEHVINKSPTMVAYIDIYLMRVPLVVRSHNVVISNISMRRLNRLCKKYNIKSRTTMLSCLLKLFSTVYRSELIVKNNRKK